MVGQKCKNKITGREEIGGANSTYERTVWNSLEGYELLVEITLPNATNAKHNKTFSAT
jgi:hypothetical protein